MQAVRVPFLVSVTGLLAVGPATAHEPALVAPVFAQAASAADGSVSAAVAAPPASGTTDLRFREMFKLPVGARGLEPSPKLLRLDGRRVRIVGYMVDQEQMRSFILAPLPLKLGDEDESLADDLPPGVVFVHLAASDDRPVHHIPGLLELTGVLSVGSLAEVDGRVSAVRLTLDPALSQEVSRHVFR